MNSVTVFLDALLHDMPWPTSQRLGSLNISRDIGNIQKVSDRTPYAQRARMIALVLAVACLAPVSIAQTAMESIAVPSRSKLLLQAIGRGDQIYGCVNGGWELKAPDAKLLSKEGIVIGRHFAGPTWELSDGSWVKGKVLAEHAAPDATAVPWLLLESIGGTGKLSSVRFIQRTWTHGGTPPVGGCTRNAIRKVSYTAAYSFYGTEQ